MAKFIEAYVSATGEKQRVPEHWIDHPVLWKGLRRTPLTKRAESSTSSKKTTNPAPKADTERSDA